MAGLDGILAAIERQSAARCAALTDRAEQDAAAARIEARTEAEALSAKIAAEAEAEAALLLQKAASAADMDTSRALLAEKVALVRQTIDEALAALHKLDPAAHAEALLSLAARFALPGAGVMQIAATDKDRLPADFEAGLASRLPAGSTLTLETDSSVAGGGCMLVYGDIVQNCTFDALAADLTDALNDEIGRILFN